MDYFKLITPMRLHYAGGVVAFYPTKIKLLQAGALGENFLHYFSCHICQPEIPAAPPIRELRMIQAHQI